MKKGLTLSAGVLIMLFFAFVMLLGLYFVAFSIAGDVITQGADAVATTKLYKIFYAMYFALPQNIFGIANIYMFGMFEGLIFFLVSSSYMIYGYDLTIFSHYEDKTYIKNKKSFYIIISLITANLVWALLTISLTGTSNTTYAGIETFSKVINLIVSILIFALLLVDYLLAKRRIKDGIDVVYENVPVTEGQQFQQSSQQFKLQEANIANQTPQMASAANVNEVASANGILSQPLESGNTINNEQPVVAEQQQRVPMPNTSSAAQPVAEKTSLTPPPTSNQTQAVPNKPAQSQQQKSLASEQSVAVKTQTSNTQGTTPLPTSSASASTANASATQIVGASGNPLGADAKASLDRIERLKASGMLNEEAYNNMRNKVISEN